MPVYASVPAYADKRPHPNTLLLIAGAHIVLVAVAMSVKMGVPIVPKDPPIVVRPIPMPEDPKPLPKPVEAEHQTHPQPQNSRLDQLKPIVNSPRDEGPTVDPLPLPNDGPLIGTNPDPIPIPNLAPAVVRAGPRFITPRNLIEPSYPEDKRRLEQEAVLQLKLTIDERGRVVAVEPVGRADPSFLEAARRHLMAHWRYRPAIEDGHAVASSTVIRLQFRLQ
jgi:protein TonB